MIKQHNLKAQGSVEMIFGMVMVAVMIFSVLKVAEWAGLEIAKVQTDHESTLGADASLEYSFFGAGPMGQVDPTPYHRPLKVDAVWEGF